MKGNRAAVAALFGGAAAQSLSVTTITLDCPTSSMVPMVTVTSDVTFTATYCPDCTAPTAPVYNGPGYTTTYTTTLYSLCSTGLVPVTHTITESCTAATPTFTPGPSYIPPGFTVTTKPCTVCGEATPVVTITEPCDCTATNGVISTPKPSAYSPASGSPPSYAPAPASPPAYVAPGPASPPGYAPAPATGNSGSVSPAPYPAPGAPAPAAPAPACSGANCGATDNSGSGAPVPYPAPAAAASSACTGASCGAVDNSNAGVTQIPDGQIQVPATGALPTKPAATPPSDNSAPITPATGSASINFISSVVAALSIGVLALAL